MAEVLQGYREIPEEDRRKAQVFFDRGKTVADSGNYEYAIAMYLSGLEIDPDAVDAHGAMREISLKRKASGGKALGFMEAMRLKRGAKDDKQAMLTAEKLLAYDPGNTDHMLWLLQSAYKAGFYDTVLWMGAILLKANTETRSPDFAKFIALRDIYKLLERWREATDACQQALVLRPQDMDLATEMKNLGALETMSAGGYAKGQSFRDSVRNMDAQRRLLDADKDVRTVDLLTRAIVEAEAEWKAEPEEIGKLSKYIDALERSEMPEYENKALELLEAAHRRTGQFRFRQRLGKIKMTQMRRMARSLRQQHGDDDPDYQQFIREQVEFELSEFKLWSDAYPTDMSLRFEIGRRLFALGRYNDAIPVLQQARQDPKFRFEAALLMGRSFLESGFVDEGIETLQGSAAEYQIRGNELAKEINYWLGRSLEAKGDRDGAAKRYSTVAQWDWNYRDVQERIRRLRAGA